MKTKTHRLCTFTFNNDTTINVAVRAFPDSTAAHRTFEELLSEAKRVGWSGDETIGRGGLKSFTVGVWVIVD